MEIIAESVFFIAVICMCCCLFIPCCLDLDICIDHLPATDRVESTENNIFHDVPDTETVSTTNKV